MSYISIHSGVRVESVHRRSHGSSDHWSTLGRPRTASITKGSDSSKGCVGSLGFHQNMGTNFEETHGAFLSQAGTVKPTNEKGKDGRQFFQSLAFRGLDCYGFVSWEASARMISLILLVWQHCAHIALGRNNDTKSWHSIWPQLGHVRKIHQPKLRAFAGYPGAPACRAPWEPSAGPPSIQNVCSLLSCLFNDVINTLW